ncbi:hypothetical protein FAES_1255 [Fibrella aestuarina BUZ 2]|uniref:Uncharacterized protein n=2 Tax=Fibrella TaxID=861914 RepID=I0K562_9BACT|nr:hypothetical protein FAES_1255 [Fibrella aestuarina BUZ 2]
MQQVKRVVVGGQRVLLFWVLAILTSHCTEPSVESQASGSCRIRQEDVVETVNGGSNLTPTETTDRKTYDYDTDGRITHTVLQREQRQQGKSINTYGVETSYTYDAAGFLTTMGQKTRWQTAIDGGSYEERTSYSYTDGRLAESVRRYQGDAKGVVSQLTSTYTYDATGQLTRLTELTTYPVLPDSLKGELLYQNGSLATITYQNGRLVDYVRKEGSTETRPYTFQNGLVSSETLGNVRYAYGYDQQDRVTKTEVWQDGQLKRETAYTYADAKSPTDTWPPFKGFPTVLALSGRPGVWATNTYRSKLPDGAFYTAAQQMQYTLTGAGFIRSATGTTTHTNYDSRNSVYQVKTVSTYAYDGLCD